MVVVKGEHKLEVVVLLVTMEQPIQDQVVVVITTMQDLEIHTDSVAQDLSL